MTAHKKQPKYAALPVAPEPHPAADDCPDPECEICAVRDCPFGEPLHYHHDGCPACSVYVEVIFPLVHKLWDHVVEDDGSNPEEESALVTLAILRGLVSKGMIADA